MTGEEQRYSYKFKLLAPRTTEIGEESNDAELQDMVFGILGIDRSKPEDLE